jgi:hypothetical protein
VHWTGALEADAAPPLFNCDCDTVATLEQVSKHPFHPFASASGKRQRQLRRIRVLSLAKGSPGPDKANGGAGIRSPNKQDRNVDALKSRVAVKQEGNIAGKRGAPHAKRSVYHRCNPAVAPKSSFWSLFGLSATMVCRFADSQTAAKRASQCNSRSAGYAVWGCDALGIMATELKHPR